MNRHSAAEPSYEQAIRIVDGSDGCPDGHLPAASGHLL